MEKKQPTFEDAIQTLTYLNKELGTLKDVVETFLDNHEDFTLIPEINKKAKTNNKGVVSPNWIMRKFHKGYSRSFRIVDLMLKDGLIEPRKSRTQNTFLIVK